VSPLLLFTVALVGVLHQQKIGVTEKPYTSDIVQFSDTTFNMKQFFVKAIPSA